MISSLDKNIKEVNFERIKLKREKIINFTYKKIQKIRVNHSNSNLVQVPRLFLSFLQKKDQSIKEIFSSTFCYHNNISPLKYMFTSAKLLKKIINGNNDKFWSEFISKSCEMIDQRDFKILLLENGIKNRFNLGTKTKICNICQDNVFERYLRNLMEKSLFYNSLFEETTDDDRQYYIESKWLEKYIKKKLFWFENWETSRIEMSSINDNHEKFRSDPHLIKKLIKIPKATLRLLLDLYSGYYYFTERNSPLDYEKYKKKESSKITSIIILKLLKLENLDLNNSIKSFPKMIQDFEKKLSLILKLRINYFFKEYFRDINLYSLEFSTKYRKYFKKRNSEKTFNPCKLLISFFNFNTDFNFEIQKLHEEYPSQF